MSYIVEHLKPLFVEKQGEISSWFEQTFKHTAPFFYTSVDIRHSGFKLAPVDTNVFPGGFNNLSVYGQERAVRAARMFMERYYPHVEQVLIVPEMHTRNSFYIDNVIVIASIVERAGLSVRVGSIQEDLDCPIMLQGHSGETITMVDLEIKGDKVQTVDGFVPDLIVANNDFTTGAPALLRNITQPVIPPVGMGWYQRRKTSHFGSYNDLARSFSQAVGIDPWLISTAFHQCGVINFKEQTGTECVALGVDKVIYKIKEKYAQYGIEEEPYVFIKSNRGTYGMGIMTARSGEDVFDLNKKIRKQMNTIKGGEQNTEVIIQEGVPTVDKVGDDTAEHMVYLVGGNPVGCMYRINERKDAYGNLNASGMRFETLANDEEGVCKVVGGIARLASFAAAWECYEASWSI